MGYRFFWPIPVLWIRERVYPGCVRTTFGAASCISAEHATSNVVVKFVQTDKSKHVLASPPAVLRYNAACSIASAFLAPLEQYGVSLKPFLAWASMSKWCAEQVIGVLKKYAPKMFPSKGLVWGYALPKPGNHYRRQRGLKMILLLKLMFGRVSRCTPIELKSMVPNGGELTRTVQTLELSKVQAIQCSDTNKPADLP